MLGFNLPDWKSSLNEALNSYVKTPLETKADNFQKDLNQKFIEFKSDNQKFHQTAIAILLASFLVITITLTWQDYDSEQEKPWS